jgi:acyl dehydratase
LGFRLAEGTWEDAEKRVGEELARVTGADDVTVADIRRRLEILAWDCPLHYDEQVARQHGYRTLVAPATMLMPWCIPAYWTPGQPRPRMEDPAGVAPLAVCTIPAPGDVMFASRSETEYVEPVYPGDRITATSTLRELTRKTLTVGDGAFFVVETRYTKQSGEVAGVERMTFFRYTPPGPDEPAPTRRERGRPPAPRERPTPEASFELPLTIQRLVMEAGTNRDFAPIHFDAEFARATGAPAPYANTMLLQAMFEAVIRTWMGPAGRLRTLAFDMRSFATAGTTLTAHLVSRDHGDLEVWIDSDSKPAAIGTATVERTA